MNFFKKFSDIFVIKIFSSENDLLAEFLGILCGRFLTASHKVI